jgi:uncharacterized protein (DUF1778 family)
LDKACSRSPIEIHPGPDILAPELWEMPGKDRDWFRPAICRTIEKTQDHVFPVFGDTMRSRHRESATARLEARITGEQKKLIDLAAAYQGRSVSDFVVQTVQQAAIAVVQEHETMRLSRQQSEAFVKALLEPSKPNEALQEAAREYRRRVRSR